MKIFNLIIIVLVTFASLFAQERQNNMGQANGRISGTVIDSESKQPIEYATVVLHKMRDSSVVTGCVTDKNGNFYFDKLNNGPHYLLISFIGYANKKIDSIFINPRKYEYDLGSVFISPKGITTGEVIIKSEREMISYNLDKKVIAVDKLITSTGGTALDIMQNIPAVNVDVDGNVSMRGNSNLTILIDGRPSGLSGISSTDVLTQIPASSIESVELVTNPSAKYDPDGTAGIINIILKKKSTFGFNGIVSGNLGTKDKYNSSLNVNLRNSYYNFFGSYDNRFGNSFSNSTSNRTNTINNSTSYIDQFQLGFNKNKMHNVNVGTDFFPDDFNTITLGFQYRDMKSDNSTNLDNKNYDANKNLSRFFTRNSFATRNIKSYEYTLSYRKTFETKGKELTADFDFSDNKMGSNNNINQSDIGTSSLPVLQQNISSNTNKMYLAQLNYVTPLGDFGRVETGFKSTIKNVTSKNSYLNYNNSTSSWLSSTSLANNFKLNEQVHAIYGIWTSNLYSIKYQIGLRAEQVYFNSDIIDANLSYKNNYFSLYPTIHLGYDISQTNEISLSYSRRVDRPNNRQLNPFIDYSDSLNIVYGNPNLKPQYLNSYELGYATTLGVTSLTSNLFYRRTNNMISTVSRLMPNGGTISTFENIAKSASYGVELIVLQPLASWWRVNANFSYFNASVEDNNISNESNSWTTKINSVMTMWEGLQFQFSFNYYSPSIIGQMGGFYGGGGRGGSYSMGSSSFSQTKMKEIYFADLGLKKDFFENKLSLIFRVSDVFNTRKFNSITTGQNFLLDNLRTMDSRIFYLGFTYRLNASDKNKDKERRILENNDDEF